MGVERSDPFQTNWQENVELHLNFLSLSGDDA